MPRYEKRTAKGVDFIDVRIHDKTIHASSSAAKGKSKATKHGSVRMAQARFRVAIEAAKKKGFEHVSKFHTPVENPKLEQEIFQHPDDDALRVIYGDWLHEQGDPRGELIAVQHKLRGVTGSRATALPRRERTLLADHSSIWYGTLDEILHERSYADQPHVRAVWRLGFFDEVEVRHTEGPWGPPSAHAVSLSVGQFGVMDRLKMSEIVKTLSQLHSARFVTRLILGGMANDYVPALKILATGWPRTLRSFTITGTLGGESTPKEHRLGSLAAFCKAHPQLEQLTLMLKKERPGTLALPRLRELALLNSGHGLSKNQLDDVLANRWPALHSFELDIGRTQLEPSTLQALFSSKLFPQLEMLRLGWLPDADYASAVATLLRESTLFKQLRDFVICGPDWSDHQQELLPVVAKALAGTHVTVTTAGREN
ncbi:MAG TPA: TIGR02996 domain-containing protein [Kofleriaceae bacterium]